VKQVLPPVPHHVLGDEDGDHVTWALAAQLVDVVAGMADTRLETPATTETATVRT
jgi:hypothetical protein